MEFCYKSFAEFEDYLYKKRLAYEELRDENRQLEMDRLRMSDRIAGLEEEEIYELKDRVAYFQKVAEEYKEDAESPAQNEY